MRRSCDEGVRSYLGRSRPWVLEDVAKQVAGNWRRWWRNSDRLLKTVLTMAYFDGLAYPDCHDLMLPIRPVRTRMPCGVVGVPPKARSPMPIFGMNEL